MYHEEEKKTAALRQVWTDLVLLQTMNARHHVRFQSKIVGKNAMVRNVVTLKGPG